MSISTLKLFITTVHIYFLITQSLCVDQDNVELRTSRRSGWQICFVFGRFRNQISTRRLAVCTETYWCFPQFFKTKARRVLKLGHDRVLPLSFQFILYQSSDPRN
jgi:hypothetical protein